MQVLTLHQPAAFLFHTVNPHYATSRCCLDESNHKLVVVYSSGLRWPLPTICCCGLQVWVPATGPGSVDGDLPDRLSDAAFDELASTAASRAAAQRQKQQQPYSPPDW